MKDSILTRKLAGVGTTVFSEMSQLAAQHNAVNLAQGFPDFDGPDFVKDAAVAAIRDAHGQYAPAAGCLALRRALADAKAAEHSLPYDPAHEITVGCGATELLFAAIQAFCDVGDEVVLFEPFYDAYRAAIWMAGATPKVVTLQAPHWGFDPQQLTRVVSERTRLLVLNSPHNPTGKVFSLAELEFIAELCCRHNLICLADEVYEHLVYEGKHVSIATLPGMVSRTIALSSMSKTFSLTGWRVGWAFAPPPLTAALRTARQFITFAAPTPLQLAAAVAVREGATYREALRASLQAKRALLRQALVDAGLTPYPAQSSYFLCAGFERYPFADDVACCLFLTQEVGVAAIPPSAFYENKHLGSSYVRFVFCKQDATLQEAAARLRRLPEKVAAKF